MDRIRRHEGAGVVTLLFLFLVLNLLTGSRSPTVWTDEVAYADPAVNVVQDDAFTSTAWEVQHSDEHWAGNVPSYQWLLSGWLTLFGIGIMPVRSLGYVLAVAAGALLWSALRRAGWVKSPVVRLLLVVTVLSGYGVTYGYRAGRPDMLGFLLLSAALWAWTLPRPAARYVALALIGVLIPIAGLQVIPFAVLLVGVGLFAAPGAFLRIGATIGGGGLIGGGALVAYYRYHDVWTAFL